MGRYETVLPPNTPRIMEALMRVHGHQLLVNGFFNADPHAGNFLLLPDGRIGLIDYGTVPFGPRPSPGSLCRPLYSHLSPSLSLFLSPSLPPQPLDGLRLATLTMLQWRVRCGGTVEYAWGCAFNPIM